MQRREVGGSRGGEGEWTRGRRGTQRAMNANTNEVKECTQVGV